MHDWKFLEKRFCLNLAQLKHVKYLNIPYAEPPTAKLRFKPPVPKSTSCAKNQNLNNVQGTRAQNIFCDLKIH